MVLRLAALGLLSACTGDKPESKPGTEAPAVCGDGVLQGIELCDDGNLNGDDGACTSACTPATCGDGLVWNDLEACDDGGANGDDAACTAACELAVCGDGLLWTDEEGCDDGRDNSDSGACKPGCIVAVCSDGLVWDGVETCDDGNALGGDGCSPTCQGPVNVRHANGDLVLRGRPSEQLGQVLTRAGDLNGDGIDDLVIASPEDDEGGTYAGAVSVFYGPLDGTESLANPDAKVVGPRGSFTGFKIASDGDLNGDGSDDLVVASYGPEVLIFFGPIAGTVRTTAADAVVTSPELYDYLGAALWTSSDLNGDGQEDLVVSAAGGEGGRGVVYVVFGPVTTDVDLASANARAVGQNPRDFAGSAVSAGDVTGDGIDDLVVSSYTYPGENYRGVTYVVNGPLSGDVQLTDADATIHGQVTGDKSGYAVSATDDLNGDGITDLVIGAFEHRVAGTKVGAAFVVLGPVSGVQDLSTANAKFYGSNNESGAGSIVSSGDLNGDGAADLIVTAGGYRGPAGYLQGATHIIHGPIALGLFDLVLSDVLVLGEEGGDYASGVYAGDLDGDGVGDLLGGAWTNETAGSSAGAMYVTLGPL